MVRGIHTRKRSGGTIRRSAFKKSRRGTRRRTRFRSGRSTTNRASGASSVGTFRGRRTSTQAWRRMLWKDTIAKQHFRSITDGTVAITTPNNLISSTLNTISTMDNFWTAAGGAITADAGGAVPTFNGDIILRGGIVRLCATNRVNSTDTTPSDPVRVTIYAVWRDTASTAAVLPILPANVSTMWDPSTLPDFQRFGKVLFKRETLLKGDGEVTQVYVKLKTQKIDQAVFINGGARLIFMVLVSQTSNTEAVPSAETIDFVVSHNLSFSSDAT